MFQWRRDVKPGSGLNYGQKSYGHIYQIPDLHSLSTDGIQGRERERERSPTTPTTTSCCTKSANSFLTRFLVCVNVYTGLRDLKTSGTHVTEPVQLIQIVDYAVLLFIVVVHCTATYFVQPPFRCAPLGGTLRSAPWASVYVRKEWRRTNSSVCGLVKCFRLLSKKS